jgi:hypothetical protein
LAGNYEAVSLVLPSRHHTYHYERIVRETGLHEQFGTPPPAPCNDTCVSFYEARNRHSKVASQAIVQASTCLYTVVNACPSFRPDVGWPLQSGCRGEMDQGVGLFTWLCVKMSLALSIGLFFSLDDLRVAEVHEVSMIQG